MSKEGRGGSENQQKHRHRHGDGEKRHHRAHDRDENRRRSSHKGHRKRSRSREGSRERLIEEAVPGHDQHGPPNYMMTGGAGPKGTLPTDDLTVAHPHPHSGHPRQPNLQPARAGIPHSPSRRRFGPDGTTPFGELPKKTADVGLAAHFRNTYRHIKAEHEAGYRSRSAIEKAVDGFRGKAPGAPPVHELEKLRKNDNRHQTDERLRDYDSRKDHFQHRGNHEGRRRRHKRTHDQVEDRGKHDRRKPNRKDGKANRDKDLPRLPTSYAPRESSCCPVKSPTHPRAPSPPPYVRHSELYGLTPSPTPAIHVEYATPPSPSRGAATSARSVSRSRSTTPLYPGTPRGRSRTSSPVVPMPQTVSPPPPPMPGTIPKRPVSSLPPPVPSEPHRVTSDRTALLDEISSGSFNLKPVRSPKGETKATYPQTSHSRDVEERERLQTWSDASDEDDGNESERRRALMETIEAQLADNIAVRFGRIPSVR
jgi:hypothetical protein